MSTVCGKRCDRGSECLLLAGHSGMHETQHGCGFWDAEPSTASCAVAAEHEARTERSDEPTLELPLPSKP